MDWNDLKVFLTVVDRKTVRSAGRKLAMHHSTVSRRIEALEDAVGARLFDRQPDGYVLTAAGERISRMARHIASEINSAEREVAGRDDSLEGIVRLTVAEPLAHAVLIPRLPEFIARYPDLELQLLPELSFLDLARREADVAVRLDNNPPQTLVGKRLFPYFETVYASPDYLKTHDVKTNPESGRWLSWAAGEQRFPEWTQQTDFPDVPTWGTLPTVFLQQAAARAGLGLAVLPCLFGDQDPGLVRASRRPPTPSRDIWLLTHEDLRRTARVRAVMSFAEEALRKLKPKIVGAEPR